MANSTVHFPCIGEFFKKEGMIPSFYFINCSTYPVSYTHLDVYKRQVLVPFVNRIDEALRAAYPGIRVITNAYGDVRIPPQNVVLNEEVVLLYCWNGCANHPIGSGECEEGGNSLGYSNTQEEAYYLGWTEHCSCLLYTSRCV